MTKTISLSQGKVARVDEEQFEWLNAWKWCAHKGRNTWYAVRRDYSGDKPKMVSMHRLLLGPPPGMETDHRNGDGLDNRRSNLRACTRRQNQMNKRKQTGCMGRFKGVCWSRPKRKWWAYIKISGKQCSLGYFDDDREAALAYNAAALEHFGEFARLNEIAEVEPA